MLRRCGAECLGGGEPVLPCCTVRRRIQSASLMLRVLSQGDPPTCLWCTYRTPHAHRCPRPRHSSSSRAALWTPQRARGTSGRRVPSPPSGAPGRPRQCEDIYRICALSLTAEAGQTRNSSSVVGVCFSIFFPGCGTQCVAGACVWHPYCGWWCHCNGGEVGNEHHN